MFRIVLVVLLPVAALAALFGILLWNANGRAVPLAATAPSLVWVSEVGQIPAVAPGPQDLDFEHSESRDRVVNGRQSEKQEWEWFHQGAHLSLEDVDRLEEGLVAEPNDFEARARVLGALHRLAFNLPALDRQEFVELQARLARNPDDAEASERLISALNGSRARVAPIFARFDQHAEWTLRNRPDSNLTRMIVTTDDGRDEHRRARYRSLWLEAVALRNDNPLVLGNAASFFQHIDPSQATELLLRARSLDPDEGTWPSMLGRISLSAAQKLSMPESDTEQEIQARQSSFREAWRYFDEALGKMKDPGFEFDVLASAAEAALGSGKHAEAVSCAQRLLDLVPTRADEGDYGDAIHDANRILGFVALREGRTEEACQRLIDAGGTPGSPALNSFGPQVDLADQLLQRGERASVLEYLRLCSRFWASAKPKMWSDEIRQGGTPRMNRFGP